MPPPPGFPGQGKRQIVPVPCSVEHLEECHKGSKTRGLKFCFVGPLCGGPDTRHLCGPFSPSPPPNMHTHTWFCPQVCTPEDPFFMCKSLSLKMPGYQGTNPPAHLGIGTGSATRSVFNPVGPCISCSNVADLLGNTTIPPTRSDTGWSQRSCSPSWAVPAALVHSTGPAPRWSCVSCPLPPLLGCGN